MNEALLGTEPHDLSRLIRAQRDTLNKLTGSEAALQGLITNFNMTTGALAQEQQNVSASIAELAPTLEQGEPTLRNLSNALPPLRALARALEPSVRELPGTIRAVGPMARPDEPAAARRGARRAGEAAREVGGAARAYGEDLAEPVPGAHATSGAAPSEVLEPTGNIVVNDGFSTGESNFHELFYGLTSLSGEMAGFDGNGPFLRLQAGGGPELVVAPNPDFPVEGHDLLFGNAPSFPTVCSRSSQRATTRPSSSTLRATRTPSRTSTVPPALSSPPT